MAAVAIVMLISQESIRKVFPTGARPILVSANDGNDYVAKYANVLPAYRLLHEYVASRFLGIWGIPTPPVEFITVNRDHLAPDVFSAAQIEAITKYPLLGSCQLSPAIDINTFYFTSLYDRSNWARIDNTSDVIDLALFDLWMANTDRRPENYNLLLHRPENGGWMINAIDHQQCFGDGGCLHDLAIIPYEESLLGTDLGHRVLRSPRNRQSMVEMAVDAFNDRVNACEEEARNILSAMPLQWGINAEEVEQWMGRSIFTQEWIWEVTKSFRLYTQQALLG